jgi:glycosyltransferase involved in cell wall biosynthesis
MRIAYVCADSPLPTCAPGAGAAPPLEMCVAMANLGFEVSLFTANAEGSPLPRLAGTQVVELRVPTSADAREREREAVVASGEIAMALASAGPFDIIYERASQWSAAPMHYARRAATTGVLELQPSLVAELSQCSDRHSQAARALLVSSLLSAQMVVTSTEASAAAARAMTDGQVQVHVVPSGHELQRLTRVSHDVGRGDFVVGYVGALEAGHGLDTLVDALAVLVATRVPHAQLLVVGGGSERQELLRRAGRKGLSDRVTCVGEGHADLPALLSKMNVAVAPHTGQTSVPPLTVIECMAAGLPIVASAIPAFLAFVRHNQFGVHFAPGDAAGLASVLGQLHADPLRIRHLAHEARAYATSHFTAGRWLERILTLAYAGADARQSLSAVG